jgi:hypothetical protein
MSPAAIVDAVRALGVELRVIDGDRVQLRPVAAVPDGLRAAIRQHRAEVAAYLRRGLPTDPPPEARICAWCDGGLEPDRQRLCRQCTDPVVARIRETARAEGERTGAVGQWQPPGAVAPPRQCVRCRGGLTAGEPDGGTCSTCRYYFSTIEPRRPQ